MTAAATSDLCRADLDRRERALSGATFVARDGPMERRIGFDVGYDHRSFGCGHGQHGMTMRFVLQGPAGAVHWVMNMPNWVPGNLDTLGDIKGNGVSVVPVRYPISDGTATDLGYHSPKPLWEGREEYGRLDCHILPDGICYYDGSGLNAAPVLAAFLEHGPMAVWATLARYYQDVFSEQLEVI